MPLLAGFGLDAFLRGGSKGHLVAGKYAAVAVLLAGCAIYVTTTTGDLAFRMAWAYACIAAAIVVWIMVRFRDGTLTVRDVSIILPLVVSAEVLGYQAIITARAYGYAQARPAAFDGLQKVRFAPSFLSFLPFVWADYWVLELAEDYSHAAVGTPDRKYLWILSREPTLPQIAYEKILSKLSAMGFEVDRLVETAQPTG